MKEIEREAYKETLGQIPVRTEKIKQKVMLQYNRTSNMGNNRIRFKLAVPAVLMILLLLSVFIFPKTDSISLKVYAADGEYMELGKEAVSLKSKYEPYLMTYSTQNTGYSCVFSFDINCESKDVKSLTYKIVGEKTASNSSEFRKNNIWFVEITDKECIQSNKDYPFDYRSMETEGEKETFTYLGSELVVEDDLQKDKNYFIEYKADKNENGELYAEAFDVQVIIENKDGTVTEKVLKFQPVFKVIKDSIGGVEIVNELWVNEK